MRLLTTCLMSVLVTAVLLSIGCSSPDERLRAHQRQSRERIEELKADLQNERDKNKSLTKELSTRQETVAQIEKENAVKDKKFQELAAEFDALAESVGRSGALPQQMSQALAEFAQANSELLSYDPAKGLISLKSDLTFALGSDQVKPEAEPVLTALGKICSTDQSKDYQVLIVGHTDDVPIARPETLAKHPTNWHLSVHRAIAVMNILKQSMPERQLAVMGFGQYRPIASNQPNHQGNPANRRVEIFIVPQDVAVPSAVLK